MYVQKERESADVIVIANAWEKERDSNVIFWEIYLTRDILNTWYMGPKDRDRY